MRSVQSKDPVYTGTASLLELQLHLAMDIMALMPAAHDAASRSFPQDFPTLRHCRDAPRLAAAIAGAAASLTSIGLHRGVRMGCGVDVQMLQRWAQWLWLGRQSG